MGTKIGLISDIHAAVSPLQHALQIFAQNKVDQILCAGDIAGYGNELEATVKILSESQCCTISGNHDTWFLESADTGAYPLAVNYLSGLAATKEFEIEGKQVYMVHAHPPKSEHGGIKLLDIEGKVSEQQKENWALKLAEFNFHILIVGHTHQVFAEKLGNIFVINPGSTQFNHTCAILQLPEMTVEFFALSGKTPCKVWNWGKYLFG